MGFSVSPMVSIPPMPQVPYASSKQAVPCIFFQQGICRKGDKCAFMHAPSFVSNKPAQPPVCTASSETSTVNKAFGGVEKSVQGTKLSQTNTLKPGELSKPVRKLENHPTKKDNAFDEKVLAPNSVINREHSRYKPTSAPPTNGNPLSGPNRMQQPIGIDDHSSMQYKDDEISREPSPGFDVLVDDELRGSDYYHDEDHYGGGRENGGRNEYDLGDSADYDSVADIDQDMYRDLRGYDSYDRLQGHYAWEQHIASSETIPGGSAHLESKRYGTVASPEHVEMSDLRHRLSKHRRANGLKSVIGHDFSSENQVEDRSNKNSRRDAHYLPSHNSSPSDRLRGRIKLPVRSSSPADGAELWLDRARDRVRLSSERPQPYSYQGRPRDRIKGRVQEDLNNDGRNNRVPRVRRDAINANNSDFMRPKSLAELKGRKTAESNDQQPLGKRKFQKLDSGDDLSFEGPMPLKEILKRKKGGEGGMLSGGSEDDQHERKHQTEKTSMTAGNVNFPSAVAKNGSEDLPIKKEEYKLVSKSADHQPHLHHRENEVEAEEEMVVEGADTQDHKGYDQRDGHQDDYVPAEGEDYNFVEGDPDDEFLEDDEDDFAKKLGIVH